MPRYSNKRQRTTTTPSHNICKLPKDSSGRQLSIMNFCFQQQRKSKQQQHSPPTPPTPASSMNTSLKTPPIEYSFSSNETPPSAVSSVTADAKIAVLPSEVNKRKNNKKRQLAQVFLDCGQRNWGQVICQKCETLYVPGVEEDEKMHSKMCEPITEGAPFGALRKLVANFGSLTIVEVRKGLRTKLMQIFEIVERDLGMTHNKSQQHPLDSPHKNFYCLNEKSRVMGLLSVKPVTTAFRMLNLYERDTQSQSCMLGVAILWTHSKMRHQGIATQLIDAAREHAVFGMVVPKSKIAFSSPTEAGFNFAKNYCGQDPLVYEYNDG